VIGGDDIVIPGEPNVAAREAVVRTFGKAWPEALVADAAMNDEPVLLSSIMAPFDLPAEMFVYRDRASYESWEQEGAAPSNVDAMIHVLLGAEDITCVVHEESDSVTARLVTQLRSSLAGV
jgi:hypothetical protein